MVALHDLFPGVGVPRNAAPNETIDDLRVFQPKLPGNSWYFSRRRRCETRHTPALTLHEPYLKGRQKFGLAQQVIMREGIVAGRDEEEGEGKGFRFWHGT